MEGGPRALALASACSAACSPSRSPPAVRATRPRSATSSIPLKAGESPVGQQLYGKKRGGTLTVYDHEDFEHFDPGEAYANEDYTITSATQRSLYAYLPNNASKLEPDVAAGPPAITERRQDGDDPDQAAHLLQPARQPRSELRRRRLRDRARRQPERRQPLLRTLLRRHRRRRKGQRRADPRDRNAEQIHDRLSPDQAHRRAARGRAQPAALRPCAAGIRQAARRPQADDVRQRIPRRDRALHAEVRQHRQVPRHRLPAGQVGDARAQPAVEFPHRLPPGVPQPDRHQHRRRTDGDRQAGAAR